MSYKRMGIAVLCITLSLLTVLSLATVVFDPYFHYHAPWSFQSYTLNNQRYQNDGICRNFDYNAIITGTSMAENFLASECDELFNVSSVKCCFSGGTYKEINDFLSLALERQPEVRLVIRSLDTQILIRDKDKTNYEGYPDYLYDDCLFNDIKYLLNKDIFLDDTLPSMLQSLIGVPSDTFDGYSFWADLFKYGKNEILKGYQRPEKECEKEFTDADAQMVRDTINQNYIEVAKNNPDVEFYVFLTPYSVVYWDFWNQTGDLHRNLEAQKIAVELMLKQKNIRVFSFLDDFDLVSDLDRYKDRLHYDARANSEILQSMAKGEHLLTENNCKAYFESVREFYTTYPYEDLF